jgi:hypothetical protein
MARESDLTTLIKEIILDLVTLIGRQPSPLHSEVRQRLDQATEAAFAIGARAGLVTIGEVLWN